MLLAYVDIVQKEFDAKELDERTVSLKYFSRLCIFIQFEKNILNKCIKCTGLYINE